jgi:hypothetical protein
MIRRAVYDAMVFFRRPGASLKRPHLPHHVSCFTRLPIRFPLPSGCGNLNV